MRSAGGSTDMTAWIHPGVLMILGAFLTPFLINRKVKQVSIVLLPAAGLVVLFLTSMGFFGSIPAFPGALHKWRILFLQYTLELGRIDKMSMIFAYVYVVIGIAMLIFALREKNDWEHVSALIHIGSSVSAIYTISKEESMPMPRRWQTFMKIVSSESTWKP